MAASINDKLTRTANAGRPTATTVTSARTVSGSTLAAGSLANWPTASAVHFVTYKIDSSNLPVSGSQCDWKGIVVGSNITQMTLTAGTDVGNAIGEVIEMLPTAQWGEDLAEWGEAHANRDGSLLTSAVQTALGLGASSLNGYNALGYAPNSVVANGNHLYTCTFNGVDLTGTLSAGMRLRTTRTVAAPTQSTSLNGTTQYWSKTSPAGMTFTDNFTASAWIKLTSYGANANIISRRSAGNGWTLRIGSTGTVDIVGFNSPGYRGLVSYPSVPLNKWVHVAGTLTLGSSTGAIYIDGALVASQPASGSTVSSLIQAGNLEVGSTQGGTELFPGKIAQAAVFSTVLSQATIQSYYSQGLSGTETGLISAYSFNGTPNDLNTTNANNLTANNTAGYTADGPFGGQADGTISSTLDYAVVRSASFSTNTTIVVQAPAGTIPTSGGVASVAYSSNAYPYNFPNNANILGLVKIASFLSTSSATDVDVPGMTTTVVVPSGATVEINVTSIIYSTVGGDLAYLRLYEDGVPVEYFQRIANGNQFYDGITWEFTRYPTAGTHTYKIMVHRESGTGAMRFGGSNVIDSPGVLKVRLAS